MLKKIYVNSFENIPYYLYNEITINSSLFDHLGTKKIFDFSVRVMNAFRERNISTLKDILMVSEEEYLEFNKFGRKSLNEVNQALNEVGLKLLKNKKDVRRFFLIKQRKVIYEAIGEVKLLLTTKNFLDL